MDFREKIIQQRVKEKEQRIEKYVDRKEKQIAYFNSLNRAIQVALGRQKKWKDMEELFGEIMTWREQFYQAWLNWFLSEFPDFTAPKLTPEEIEALEEDRLRQEMEEREEYDPNWLEEKRELQKKRVIDYEPDKTSYNLPPL